MNKRQFLFSFSLLTGLLLGNFTDAVAQKNQDVEEDLLTSKEKNVLDYTSKVIHQRELIQNSNNNAIVNQNGPGHISHVIQTHTSGDPNLVYITQNGNGHTSSVNQQGSGNTTVVDQDGRNHVYSGNIVGNDNEIMVTQKGNGHTFEHDLIGNGGQLDIQNSKFKYSQIGDNNTLIIRDSNNSAPPQIIQEGHDMNLRIEVR